MAKNMIDAHYVQKIEERPKWLDTPGRTERATRMAKLYETLKLIEGTKMITYDKAEFEREFGSAKTSGKQNVYSYLLAKQVLPVIKYDGDKVYMWLRRKD